MILAMRSASAVIGLIVAVPLVFVVALTQVNSLQDTSKGLVPAALDGIFGTTTFIILLLVIPIIIGSLIAGIRMFRQEI